MYLGQQWLRQWPVAWQYQAIFWASVDLSSKVFCSIYLRIVSVEMLNRKHKVYVYVKGEHLSTLQKMNNYLRCEYKVNKRKVLPYYETLRNVYKFIYINIIKNNEKVVTHYVKLKNPLPFQTRFPKGGSSYRRQMVNLRHQLPQQQSAAKPETPL